MVNFVLHRAGSRKQIEACIDDRIKGECPQDKSHPFGRLLSGKSFGGCRSYDDVRDRSAADVTATLLGNQDNNRLPGRAQPMCAWNTVRLHPCRDPRALRERRIDFERVWCRRNSPTVILFGEILNQLTVPCRTVPFVRGFVEISRSPIVASKLRAVPPRRARFVSADGLHQRGIRRISDRKFQRLLHVRETSDLRYPVPRVWNRPSRFGSVAACASSCVRTAICCADSHAICSSIVRCTVQTG